MSVLVREDHGYQRQIEQWRQERDASLRAPDGWLSLAGLFELEEGEYSLGSGEENRIILPSSAPDHLGTLRYGQEKATLQLFAEVDLSVDDINMVSGVERLLGDPVLMVDNANGQRPTMVRFGTITLNLHRFGDDVALRVRDSETPAITDFSGCEWYAIKEAYRIAGHLIRQDEPTPITVTTSVKTAAHYQSVGTVFFELLGMPLQLLASATSKPNELFIIFRDATAGRTTYGAGRYLYAAVDAEGNVTLDFNKAYSPPCAFTPYATCSLPPAQNILQVAVEAGERYG